MRKPIRPDPRKRKKAVASVSEETLILENTVEVALRSIAEEVRSIHDPLLRDQYHYAMTEVAKDGDLEHMLELARYRRGVVPLDEFLHSATYMGLPADELYPGVMETLVAIDTEKYVECVLKGAIGGGKTTLANLSIIRQLYKLSCMRSPQQTFGVQKHSSIVFTIQSVRLTTAKKAVFDEMVPFMENSPYFREVYPFDRRITSALIFRQQRVSVLPVSSSDTGAISMNVIGGMLDEVNFMEKIKNSKNSGAADDGDYNQAKTLYLNLSKRRRSRFLHRGKLPGTLFLVSSSRYPDDFTEEKAAEAEMCGGDDPAIYVSSKSLWESKGRDSYSPKSFNVLIGNERVRSRILSTNEKVRATDGCSVLSVPEDFRLDFTKDIDGSIRDFGGKTTLATHPFIQNREALFACMQLADQYAYQSVITVEDTDLEVSIPSVMASRVRTDVKSMRVAHVDLGVVKDAAGLAVGHVAGVRALTRVDPETGKKTIEVLPVIGFDLILRILPPRDGEINFAKIRQILYTLRDVYGLPIKVVSTDGFQSTDFKQILAKKNFATEYLSVDRTTMPYRTTRDAIYDKRLLLPRHQTLIKELTELEYVRYGSREKVDHRPNGSKDIADAVCGVTSYLMTRRSTWAAQPTFRGENGLLLYGHRTGIGSVELDELSQEEITETFSVGKRRSSSRRKASRVPPRQRKKMQ